MNLSLVPDLTMRGAPSPYAPPPARTVGRLAGLVHEAAARPDRWWHLVRFDGVPVRLDGELWLSAWPPGHRADPGAGVLVVVAGELTEPGARRALRAGRVHVHGEARPRELTNPGPGYAVTLHASAAPGQDGGHHGDARERRRGGVEPMPVRA